MFFDKIENGIKETPYKRFLEGVYGGKKLNKTTCKNCGAISTRKELFYNLSLKVKNIKNIFDSLEDHNQEETISDFRCDKCN
jgi:ubiquitin carboxyl-terminal hydrolase 34